MYIMRLGLNSLVQERPREYLFLAFPRESGYCFVMVIGIGTDLVLIEEFTQSADAQPGSYIERIFTPHEITEAGRRANPYEVLAARFAAKEAFMKAMGTGWRGDVDWLHIEVRTDEAGKPSLILSGSTERLAKAKGVAQVHISMSHTVILASAVVVLEDTATPQQVRASD